MSASAPALPDTVIAFAYRLESVGLWGAATRIREASIGGLPDALDDARRELWGATNAIHHMIHRYDAKGLRRRPNRFEAERLEALEALWAVAGELRFAGHLLGQAMRHLTGVRWNGETLRYEAVAS